MSDTIGVGVGRSRIRGVLLRRGEVVWRGAVPRPDVGEMSAGLETLLSDLPRVRRPQLQVAVGPSDCHLRPVHGLPGIDDASVLRAMVSMHPRRFFAHSGHARISSLRRIEDRWWAAAFDESVIEAISNFAQRRGFKSLSIAPVASALGCYVRNGTASCWEAGLGVTVEAQLGVPFRVERFVADDPASAVGGGETVGVQAPDGTAPLDAHADAHLAALMDRETPFVVHPLALPRARRLRAATRGMLLGAIALAAATVLAGPALRATMDRRAAEKRLAAASASATTTIQGLSVFEARDRELRSFEGYLNHRRSMLAALGALTEALPESTAIISIRVDDSGAFAVLLSPVGSPVLENLGDASGLEAVQLASAMTREQIGGTELQRMSVRFQLSGRSHRPRSLGRTVEQPAERVP